MKDLLKRFGNGALHIASPEGAAQFVAFKAANKVTDVIWDFGETRVRKWGWFGLKPLPSPVYVETPEESVPSRHYLKEGPKGNLHLISEEELKKLKADRKEKEEKKEDKAS